MKKKEIQAYIIGINIFLLILILNGCTSKEQNGVIKNSSFSSVNNQKINPRAANYNVQLGIAYLQKGDVERAKNKLQLAMKQDPFSWVAIDGMAYYWDVTGERRRAEALYKKAIDLADNKSHAQNNYGAFLCKQKAYREAIKYFLLAAHNSDYTTPAQAYENAGLCALQIPELSAAENYFKDALKRQPNLPHSLLELSQIYYEKAEPLKAKYYLQQFLKISSPTSRSQRLSILLAKKISDGKV